MDLELIARLMRLLETSDLDELDVTENGMRIRLAKSAASAPPSSPGRLSSDRREEAGDDRPATDDNRHVIFAGLPGTFYRRPVPDEPPFVDIGDEVEDGRKLAIVEAMKMMNPVEADCAGRIVAIHLDDGAPVAAGTPLFTLEKTGPRP